MTRGTLTSHMLTALAILALAAVAFYGGTALRAVLDPGAGAAYADQPQYTGPPAVAEKITVDGEEQGMLVLAENRPVYLQAPADGLSGFDQAVAVADRLNAALTGGLTGDQVTAREVGGAWTVAGGEATLITVTDEEAGRWQIDAADLARIWATNLAVAIDAAWQTQGGPPPTQEQPAEEQPAQEQPVEEQPAEEQPAGEQPAAEQPVQEQPAEEHAEEQSEEWQPSEPYKDKIVPIISIGEGKRIGVARINGPSSKVAQVQAVAQLETSYKDMLDIEIYVPISTKVPGRTLSRIQGVGVTGVGDLRL